MLEDNNKSVNTAMSKHDSMVEDSTNDKFEELKKLIPEQAENSKNFFDGFIKKGIIVCNVWLLGKNGARDKLIGSKKRKVGKTDFVVKGKRYWINYEELKEGKRNYIFDVDVENAIGALSFHKTEKQKVKPNQADSMLVDGVVRVLMGKGGIPALWLLIAMLMTFASIAGLVIVLLQYQDALKDNGVLSMTNTNLKNENRQLETQLEIERGIIVD